MYNYSSIGIITLQKNISIFTHEFLLKTNKYQKRKLFIKFIALRELYNMVLGEILKRNRKMIKDPKYAIASSLYRNEKTKKEGSVLFNELNTKYFLLKSNLQSFATQAKNSSYMADHLDGDTVQVISDRAYNAYMNYKFGKKGKPRFKPRNKGLRSISGKKNNCVMFKDGKVKWKDLLFDVIYDKKDKHGVEAHALSKKVKYCRIIGKLIKGEIRYYLQLVVEGLPLIKQEYPSLNIGVDMGPSTAAVVGDSTATLQPFCAELEDIQKEIAKLQRKSSRSNRMNNPQNFEPNFYKEGKKKLGKVIKGKRVWINSKTYKNTLTEIQELYRIQADKRKTLHNVLANETLSLGKFVKIENNNYKAWQKGWFGKTIGFRAPSTFVSILKRKAESAGGKVDPIDTWTSKLSQYCHVCNGYHKKALSERTHTCGEITVQRDLYSALLIKHYDLEAKKVNTTQIHENWESFDTILKDAVLTCRDKFRLVGKLPTSLGIQELEKRNSHKKSVVVSSQCLASNKCESMKKKPEETANKNRIS
jgi:putative transposase